MPKRLALALFGALACVLAASAGSAVLSLRAHRARLQAIAERAAAAVRLGYEREERAIGALLREVCARDAQVERFGLELAAGRDVRAAARESGDGAEAERTALGLRRAIADPAQAPEVWLLGERAGAVALLGGTGDVPPALPSAGALRATTRSLRTWGGGQPWVLASCARALGPSTLWLVRAEPLAALRARLSPADPSVRFIDGPEPHGSDRHADALALRLEAADEAPPTELWLRASEPPRLALLWPLAPLFALLSVFAALLAYFLATRRAVADADLEELERAAERVAKGDLSGRIERRSGGRADQTFATFDRMTAELKEMRVRLAEAERAAAWQDMARRIAHEIKNPLAPIRTAIETLRKAEERKLPAFAEIFDESTRAILEEVRRLERIVREFSEFARLPRARPGAFELSALVADTIALYQPEGIRVELVGDPVEVRADREQITQVIVNLLQNACDAARAHPEPRVELRVEADARSARLHVDDNGPGLPAGARERVFEPYYTTKPHGTGLGLAIVRRIALDHEGGVEVGESPLGGARFTLRLPRASTAPAA